MNFIDTIEDLISSFQNVEDVPDTLESLFAGICFSEMRSTPQDPVYHGEGDVLTHTLMVCNELIRMESFQQRTTREKTELFLAALLHDIGKVKTTCLESGTWVSPHHSSVGSRIVREFLWRGQSFCGTPERTQFRETVCALIRHHMRPVWLLNGNDPVRKVRKIASAGELIPDFTWDLLCVLAEADVRGRIASDRDEGISRIRLSRIMAEEAECLTGPYAFPDPFTRHAYLSGRDVVPGTALFDDTWGEVLMLSGLPGTGKDRWIAENVPDLAMISLDEIRSELRVRPKDDQGEVVQTARNRAREYLRRRQPFIWNATNLSPEIRKMQVSLFKQYGASVRIIYLERDWELRRFGNTSRKDAVPEQAVERLLSKTVPPMPEEAHRVEWYF